MSAPATEASFLSKIGGVLFAIVVLGLTVYALVAVMFDWAPASWVIDLEVRASFDGRYGMVEAWAVTWFHLLAVATLPLVPPALVSLREDTIAALDVRAEARWRGMRRTRLPAGALLVIAVVSFYACAALAPEVLATLGILTRLALVLAPFALFLGPALVLDAVLAPKQLRVTVARIDPYAGEHQINGLHSITTSELTTIRVGSEISIVVTRALGSVLSITPLDPYR
ncbi:MAG: hypothetical protein J0L92_15115 [Deltaproteobacteria bacterium]|nr:hypothetical protein [Deltaproteobacteria bacterium]